MQCIIRPYDDATDRAKLIALYRAAWHAAYDAIDGADTIERLITALTAGDTPEMFALPAGDLALVADDQGRIIGGARAHPRADGVHISGLYVLPEMQHAGVGAALLAILLAKFPRDAVWRTDVRPEGPATLKFYARHGFAEVARGRADVGGGLVVDMIEMRRDPSAASTSNDLWSQHLEKHSDPGRA